MLKIFGVRIYNGMEYMNVVIHSKERSDAEKVLKQMFKILEFDKNFPLEWQQAQLEAMQEIILQEFDNGSGIILSEQPVKTPINLN